MFVAELFSKGLSQMTRYVQILLIGVAFALVAGGCGGSDDTIDIQIFPAVYDTDPQAPPPRAGNAWPSRAICARDLPPCWSVPTPC